MLVTSPQYGDGRLQEVVSMVPAEWEAEKHVDMYWSAKQIPELRALDDAERNRVWRSCLRKCLRRPPMWISLGVVLAFTFGGQLIFFVILRRWPAMDPSVLGPWGAVAGGLTGTCVGGRICMREMVRLVRAELPTACPLCGFDLRASPVRCPECGERKKRGSRKKGGIKGSRPDLTQSE